MARTKFHPKPIPKNLVRSQSKPACKGCPTGGQKVVASPILAGNRRQTSPRLENNSGPARIRCRADRATAEDQWQRSQHSRLRNPPAKGTLCRLEAKETQYLFDPATAQN